MEKKKQVIRETIGDGKWFPGNRDQLKSMVDGYIDGAEVPKIPGRIIAAIAPHAGYVYSGRVAGHTFRALKENAVRVGMPDVVVVIGFSHSRGFKGVALMDGTVLESPLGKVELDVESVDFLAGQSDRIFLSYEPHNGEHSAENEVPFVQTAFPDAKILVGLMGDHDEATLKELVSALVSLSKKKKIVVVASTDLLHYADYDLVTSTDAETLKKISALDDAALMKSWGYQHQVCCGVMPVLAVMRYSKALGCVGGKTLMYRNSGDDNPASRGSFVVGYGSVVFSVE